MSTAGQKRSQSETLQEKRARLEIQLIELVLEEQEAAAKTALVEQTMQTFFAKPLLLAKIVAGFAQLKFGKVQLIPDICMPPYTGGERSLCGDAASLKFTDAAGRQYECVVIAPTQKAHQYNRADLVFHDDRSLRKVVKPMYTSIIEGEWDAHCDLASWPFKPGFTAAMLPFDEELNQIIASSRYALRLFDITLFGYAVEAARAYAAATAVFFS